MTILPQHAPPPGTKKQTICTVKKNGTALLWATILSLWLLFFPCSLSAHTTTWDDTQVKAAFIYNLTFFIFWEQKDLGEISQPFRILVIGDENMGNTLKQITSHESVLGHRMTVENTPLRALSQYRIIFVPDSMTSRTKQLLTDIRDGHTLLIGENKQFLEQGGMISFIRTKNRVKIYYNRQALQAAHLQVSAKLYQVAISSQESGDR